MSEVRSQPGIDAPLKVVLVDISEHRRQLARDVADARLSDETAANYQSKREALTDVRGFVRRIWKGNIVREYYQQKYYREELGNIDTNGNLYEHIGGDDTLARQTVIARFASEYDEAIHTDAGESRNIYNSSDRVPNNLRDNIQALIADYASGTLDEDSFEEEKNRVCALLANGDQDKMTGSLVYADNLLEIAQNVRAAMGHGRALDELMSEMQIVTGEAQMGTRTEARFNKVDKVVDKLSRSRIGSLLPEALIASSVAVASGVIKYGSQKALSTALAVTGILGISGGVIGALRESKRIKEERAQHMRERASGKEFASGARRREAMEDTRYETVGATDIIERLNSLYDGDSLRSMSADEYVRVSAEIAAISSRIKLSDTGKIDLIHFSSTESIEDERFALDLALAQAKVRMSQYLGGQPPDFLPTDLGMASFDELLQSQLVAATAELTTSNDAKDVAFNQLKRKEVFKAARRAFGWGMVLGATMQEAMAHVPGNSSFAGLGESNDGATRTTTLHALFQGKPEASPAGTELVTTNAGAHSTIKIPDGYKIEQSGNHYVVFNQDGEKVAGLNVGKNGNFTPHSIEQLQNIKGAVYENSASGPGVELSGETKPIDMYDKFNKVRIPKEYSVKYLDADQNGWHAVLLDQNGDKVTKFTLNPDGSMSKEGMHALRDAGFRVHDAVDKVKTTQEVTNASPEQMISNTLDQTKMVHREGWYGNDTPNVFDQNELRAHAGGINGDWYDSQGNVVIDVTPMTPNGSYWHGQAANPWELASEGKLKTGVSVSTGTQNFVYDFDIKETPDGRLVAVIPKNSPAHQLFEPGNQHSGHGDFNGRYIEIMEFKGDKDPAGADNVWMLATYKGDDDASGLRTIIDTTRDRHIATITPKSFVNQVVTFNPEVTSVDTSLPVTPIIPIPIYGRRGLERVRAKTPERYGYGRYNGYGSNIDSERQAKLDQSPRLQGNPDAKLNIGEELDWYRTELRSRRGQAYEAQIDASINADPSLSELTDVVDTFVCIPVAATSEMDRIYSTLSLYAQQPDESKNASQILLHVNWVDDQMSDPAAAANRDKTLAEIERARRDFPELKISLITTEYQRSFVKQSGGVIGDVVRKMYDTAMMSVQKSISEGRRDPSREVLVIRNDADAIGMDHRYLERMRIAAEREDVDSMSAAFRWQTDTHGNFPGFGIVSNWMEVCRVMNARQHANGHHTTSGANSAVKMSTLAAIGSIGFTTTKLGAGSDDIAIGERVRLARYGSGRKTFQYVVGAQIDTDAQRLLGFYRAGQKFTNAWDRFDENGHRLRTEVPEGIQLINKEDPWKDIDGIAHRVETCINSLATEWYQDRSFVEAALRFSFPKTTESGAPIYTIDWPKGGECSFRFTAEGKKWLQNAVAKDWRRTNAKSNKNWFDRFGTRTRRRLYNEKVTAANPATRSVPRFVKAIG